MNLGISGFQSSGGGNIVENQVGASASSQIAELNIENERLKTTLTILNQKLKINEDNEDILDKWKSQVEQKDE